MRYVIYAFVPMSHIRILNISIRNTTSYIELLSVFVVAEIPLYENNTPSYQLKGEHSEKKLISRTAQTFSLLLR